MLKRLHETVIIVSTEIIVFSEDYLTDPKKYVGNKVWIVYEKTSKTPQNIQNNWINLVKPENWIIVVDRKTNSKWLLHPMTHEKIKNKNFIVSGSNETRSFCYANDAIDAVLNIFNKVNNEIVNVGNDEEILIMDAVKIISSYYNVNDNWQFKESLPGSTLRRLPCINKLRKYYPAFSPVLFSEGIKKVLDYENF